MMGRSINWENCITSTVSMVA